MGKEFDISFVANCRVRIDDDAIDRVIEIMAKEFDSVSLSENVSIDTELNSGRCKWVDYRYGAEFQRSVFNALVGEGSLLDSVLFSRMREMNGFDALHLPGIMDESDLLYLLAELLPENHRETLKSLLDNPTLDTEEVLMNLACLNYEYQDMVFPAVGLIKLGRQ